MNTKKIGDIGESAIISEFVYYGISVYLPFGDNEAFDLLAYFDGKFQKIQVKTSSKIKDGKIDFKLGVRRYNADHSYSTDEVDYFALYCIENRKCYLYQNTEKSNSRSIFLRVSSPLQGQVKYARMAEDYEFKKKFSGLAQ